MISLAFHLFVVGTVIFALCSYDCCDLVVCFCVCFLFFGCCFSTLCLQVGNRLGF